MEKGSQQITFPKHLSIEQKTLSQIISNTTNKDKLKLLKSQTEEYLRKSLQDSTKITKTANKIKSLVSQDKNRFCFDGFDLDLSYITPKIIAMGLPSTSIEGLFRNSMEDVQKFLNTRHPQHYKVYNLCEEKEYPPNLFYKQAKFPFKDHEAPPLNIILPFCKDAAAFLNQDPNNVIAIHCLAGKGRTGTLISCLLCYMKYFDTATECLQYYGMMRVENGKGVTVPSQIRYVYYFECILKSNIAYPIEYNSIVITNIKMITVPPFSGIGSYCCPNFILENGENVFKWSDINKTKDGYPELTPELDFPIPGGFEVKGDVRIMFEHIKTIGKNETMFKLWFNTIFVPKNGVIRFPKGIVDKACKDTACKHFKDKFAIEVHCKFA